ncbi:MAG: hypothetical protein GXO76_08155 [Calditrichaeota bacterium]|nr:hypothetical protein [Calditrichota bacterium]
MCASLKIAEWFLAASFFQIPLGRWANLKKNEGKNLFEGYASMRTQLLQNKKKFFKKKKNFQDFNFLMRFSILLLLGPKFCRPVPAFCFCKTGPASSW